MSKFGSVRASSWGYACFLTINATSTWGGVFPFLPVAFQTAQVTLIFFLAQALAFGGTFLASAVGSYYVPHATRRMLVALPAALVFAGSAALIAAMYVPAGTLWLVGGSGVLLGVGSAGLFMLWQRYFASLPARQGSMELIVGTLLAPVLYFVLTLVPIAVTAFLVPLVFVPLCALCISLSVRVMSLDQSMFEDIPRQQPQVYRQVLADYWRNALCIGALALVSGVMRGIALRHEDIFALVNGASMAGLFATALVMLLVWTRTSFRFGITTVFRVAYPLLATGLLLVLFFDSAYLNFLAGTTYMVFSLVQMLMMMQCAQISRDRGINPVFIFGFFGGVVYLAQSMGFLVGWVNDGVGGQDVQWLFFLTMLCSYVLGVALLVSTGSLLRPQVSSATVTADPIELPRLREGVRAVGARAEVREAALEAAREVPAAAGAAAGAEVPEKRRRNRASASPDADVIVDRLSKRCLILQEDFGLSTREREVTELIARGNSVAAIAERLIISENTVRTHAKHIYSKLDIHKRQELLELLG